MLIVSIIFAALVLEPFVTAKGTVLDSEGATIPKVRVIYHRDLAGELAATVAEDHGVSDGTAETDKSGTFTANIHPGLYDICVMKDAFTPQCEKVEVSLKKPAFPIFHLKADPLVTKRIGDTFPSSKP